MITFKIYNYFYKIYSNVFDRSSGFTNFKLIFSINYNKFISILFFFKFTKLILMILI